MGDVVRLEPRRRLRDYKRIQQDVAEKKAAEGDEERREFLLDQLRKSGILKAKRKD